MLSYYKCFYLLLLTTFLTPMVVQATNILHQSQTLRKSHYVSVSRQLSSYGLLENRISKEEHRQTHWTREFLAKREAKPHSAPYIVSIQVMRPDAGFIHYCAGTIINEHWILTAAHCLGSRRTLENSVIVAGAHDIHALDDHERVQLRNIDHHVVHELYLGGVNPYDIALIYTKTPLKFTEYVQPAQLPVQDAEPEGFGTLFGWGNVSMTVVPKYPHKLHEANMPILDMALCEQILAESGLPLHATNLCTGPLSGGVSICTADSGGPLMQQCCRYYKDCCTVIGIVSWGKKPCGQSNAPSVFVRVSAFTDWINDIITSSTRID